jgi:hypothetical protein
VKRVGTGYAINRSAVTGHGVSGPIARMAVGSIFVASTQLRSRIACALNVLPLRIGLFSREEERGRLRGERSIARVKD